MAPETVGYDWEIPLGFKPETFTGWKADLADACARQDHALIFEIVERVVRMGNPPEAKTMIEDAQRILVRCAERKYSAFSVVGEIEIFLAEPHTAA